MKLAKTSTRNGFIAALTAAAALLLAMIGGGRPASAQSTFVGEYDTSFAAPKGYYVDPQDVDPTIDDNQTLFFTGGLLPNGSIIAGGPAR